MVAFLNTAEDRAERHQQVIELRIAPAQNAIGIRAADLSINKTLEMPDPVRIISVEPALVNQANPELQRRFLIYPGGTIPRIAIELGIPNGRKRRVSVDPITGMPHSDLELQ